MKLTLIASMAALITLAAVGQVHKYDPPTKGCKLLKANPPTIESGEAIRLAINKVIPQALGDPQNGDAQVVVTVAVDKGGSPQCVAAIEDYPLLARACIEAVKGWKFDPYTAEGHEVPFVTRLTFRFTQQKVRVE
jgi:TonB-like protein